MDQRTTLPPLHSAPLSTSAYLYPISAYLYPMIVAIIAAACGKSGDVSALEKARHAAEKKQTPANTGEHAAPPTKTSGAAERNAPEITPERTNRAATAGPSPKKVGPAVPDPSYILVPVATASQDSAVRDALASLSTTGKEKTMRETFERLQKAGKPAVEGLLSALRAKRPNIRTQAALILRRMEHRSDDFTKSLNAMLLSDPDPDVRGIAGRVMVYYLERKTVPALMTALEKDADEAVRMHAAWALGAIKDKRATQALITALKDGSTDVRLRSVGALKRMRARKALPYLVACLEDDNSLVQTRAYEALKKISGKSLKNDVTAWRKAYPLRTKQ